MGLANVRRIMERHGGTVEAEAVPDEGAAFTLVFPPASIVLNEEADEVAVELSSATA
jgi:signal transduction histidine kinase